MNQSVNEAAFGMSCEILGKTHFVITKLPSVKFVINFIFAITFNGLLMIPTILLNAIAIITIFKSHQLKSKPCYFIILVQSIIDLGAGVLSVPLFIFFLASGIGGITNCVAASLAFKLATTPGIISCVNLSVMTLERYIAIIHPYAYKTQVTIKRLLIYLGCGVVVSISSVFLFVFEPRFYYIFLGTLVTLLFFFIAFANTKIYLVVRKLSRSPNRPHDPAAEENTTKLKVFLGEIKHAKSCFMVVVCFAVLCFIPGASMLPFFPSMKQYERQEIIAWVYPVGFLNSTANSIIFFWTKTMLRKEAVKTLNTMFSM